MCGPTLVHPKKIGAFVASPRSGGELERQMGKGFSCFKSEVLPVYVDLSLSGNKMKHEFDSICLFLVVKNTSI